MVTKDKVYSLIGYAGLRQLTGQGILVLHISSLEIYAEIFTSMKGDKIVPIYVTEKNKPDFLDATLTLDELNAYLDKETDMIAQIGAEDLATMPVWEQFGYDNAEEYYDALNEEEALHTY